MEALEILPRYALYNLSWKGNKNPNFEEAIEEVVQSIRELADIEDESFKGDKVELNLWFTYYKRYSLKYKATTIKDVKC